MAEPNLTQAVASAWEAKVGTKPTDNIHNDYWTLHNFDQGDGWKGVDGGRLIEISIEYGVNTTFKSYDDLETLDTTRIPVFDAAQFQWKQIAGTVVISEKEKAFTQGSGGKFDLLAGKLENAKNSHDRELNRQIYTDGTGNAGKDIGGFLLLIPVLPALGTVGGISRVTYTWWRSIQAAGTKTTTAYDNLRSAMTTVYNTCSQGVSSEHPNVVVSGIAMFGAYEGLLVAVEQIVDKKNADIAFKGDAIKFKGANFAYDVAVTLADAVYMWNTAFLKMYYQRNYWKKMFPPVDPANQTADVYKILTICNLGASALRRAGIVSAIT